MPRIHRSRSLVTMIAALAISVATTACSYMPFRGKESYLNRGQKYMAKGKFSEAAIEYRKALQLDPRYVDALSNLAHADIAIGRWNDAYGALQQASKLAPERLDLHLELGRILFDARKYPDAEEEASTVLKGQARRCKTPRS